MQDREYIETIEWLFNQFPAYHKIGATAYKPDLENCSRLASYFNNPQNHLKFVHIAGTNGKGSTSSMLASILQESSEKVGLFTSPHIEDFRERIRVNGEMISEIDVIEFCTELKSMDLSFEPSFFEITWVMALVFFSRKKCTICVIETGLGGRLDATNLITPILSIITNIGLEHTNFLGDTVEKIAFEKAGIIKSTIPVIVGETTSQTKSVFEEIARVNKSELFFAEEITTPIPVDFPLIGEYQKKNFKIIETAIPILRSIGFSIDGMHIHNGLIHISKNTGFRGRMQIINHSPLTIIDVSHNFDGIKATLESIENLCSGNLHIVYGTSSDKDLKSIFTLFPEKARYYFTEFSNERSAKMEELQAKSKAFKLSGQFFKNPKEALKQAEDSANKEDTILVFGSFFLISDFF